MCRPGPFLSFKRQAIRDSHSCTVLVCSHAVTGTMAQQKRAGTLVKPCASVCFIATHPLKRSQIRRVLTKSPLSQSEMMGVRRNNTGSGEWEMKDSVLVPQTGMPSVHCMENFHRRPSRQLLLPLYIVRSPLHSPV